MSNRTRQRDAALVTELLRHLDLRPPLWRFVTGKRFVLLATLAVVGLHAAYLLYWRGDPIGTVAAKDDPLLAILATVAAGIVFLWGYVQWHLGREEASFDRFYDRIGAANVYRNLAGAEAARLAELKPPNLESPLLDHHRNMIVFTSLDTLEYVLAKHRLNYVDRDLLERAVGTFRAHCAEAWFRSKTLLWTDGGVGYRERTRTAARFLADKAQDGTAA